MSTVGQKAPAFSLLNQDGKEVSLGNLSGKWLVIYFYPKDDTPGCSIEAQDFTRLRPEFEKVGCSIIGISPDSASSHCRFIEKKSLALTLLADEEKKMCTAYGVWGKKKFMGREFMGIIRSTFLVNPQGKIVAVWSPVSVNGHAQEVLEKVKGLVK